MDSEISTVNNMIIEAFFLGEGSNGRIEKSFCASIEWDRDNTVLTLDFGDGCESQNGRLRKGKIKVDYNNIITGILGQRTVTFENFEVDGNRINGTFSTSGISRNAQDQIEFDRDAQNVTINFSDGTSFTWNAQHRLTWVEGEGTMDIFSNVFEISGSSSGVDREGRAFVGSIQTPLRWQASCVEQAILYPVSGSSLLTVGNTPITVDFGNGACNKTMTISFGPITKEIELP